jgi:ribonuclease Z
MTDSTASSDLLKVTLLGTGIPNPQINAFGTSTLIEAGDQKVLIDCGRGAAIRLSQIGLGVGCVDTIFISHYHSDHFSGLFDMAMTGSIPQKFGGRTGPLHVHGPSGIADIAEGAWQATCAGPRHSCR